jgi:hypothetical protein
VNISTFVAWQRFVEPLPPRAKHVHADDELILEDQTGRVKLAGNVPVCELVTGTYGMQTPPLTSLCGQCSYWCAGIEMLR